MEARLHFIKRKGCRIGGIDFALFQIVFSGDTHPSF